MAIVAADLNASIARLQALTELTRKQSNNNAPRNQDEVNELQAVVALLKTVQTL